MNVFDTDITHVEVQESLGFLLNIMRCNNKQAHVKAQRGSSQTHSAQIAFCPGRADWY